MNIKEAKNEIKNTLKAYLRKDAAGNYKIPAVRQRPILLMGPPGIGKTAIVEQAARECQVLCVAYTITHHTRQSAIGLPFIEKREYDGKEYSVTEYTMSEIIASIYDKMAQSGQKEGILFIDEINCVSETLAPAMLQFLQGKTFGSHKVPEGFIIVAAGNPPEYNKSVHDFDIVTLDRIRRIDITEDFSVWKEYGSRQGIHDGILTYLEIRKNHFYRIETTVDGKWFVTARGWEDLSEILCAYEELGIETTKEIILEYLQHPKIASDFSDYLKLYIKYEKEYDAEGILKGRYSKNIRERLKEAPFDERISVTGLLLGKLNEGFMEAYETRSFVNDLYQELITYKEGMESKAAYVLLEDIIKEREAKALKNKAGGLLEAREAKIKYKVTEILTEYLLLLKSKGINSAEEGFLILKAEFEKETGRLLQITSKWGEALENSFAFMEEAFFEGQEMVLFVSELTNGYYSMEFISENGSESYYKYNQKLLFHQEHTRLLEKIHKVLD